jgi:hypothetical protein
MLNMAAQGVMLTLSSRPLIQPTLKPNDPIIINPIKHLLLYTVKGYTLLNCSITGRVTKPTMLNMAARGMIPTLRG